MPGEKERERNDERSEADSECDEEGVLEKHKVSMGELI